METTQPLVSILIPNYNHSKYLDQCIQSALNQTYKNIEVIMLDNVSTDNSVQLAADYMYDERFRVCRNQFNIMNASYSVLADVFAQGKYMILLCADDFIFPDFIERAVSIMEEYPNVAYVHGEKDFYTEEGEKKEYDAFYKCSFVAPGINVMPIYMVTTVAHPSQGVIRRSAFFSINGYDKEIDHMNADRTLWFYLSYQYDAAYIREKMCGIRVGIQTETFVTQKNFRHPILCHLTILDFVKYAKENNLPEVYNREEEALERLSHECVGYSVGMLSIHDYHMAQQYLMYARLLNRGICDDEKYKGCMQMIKASSIDEEKLRSYVVRAEKKKRGYEPPKGYMKLD